MLETGNNSLYNVLNAYAMYDKEIGYCQGMNIITAWLLKFTQEVVEGDDGELKLRYDEVNAFYCLIHIMENHGWREVYDSEMSKL